MNTATGGHDVVPADNDGALAAAAAWRPAAGAGEMADELQPPSAADLAAAEQLMKEEVSRCSYLWLGNLSATCAWAEHSSRISGQCVSNHA